MLDNGGVGRSLVEQLQQRGATVLTIDEPLSPAALEEQIKTWLAAGPIDGVYWLPALDVEPAIDQTRSGGMARTQSCAREESLHDDARSVRSDQQVRHIPDRGDAARRSARLR